MDFESSKKFKELKWVDRIKVRRLTKEREGYTDLVNLCISKGLDTGKSFRVIYFTIKFIDLRIQAILDSVNKKE